MSNPIFTPAQIEILISSLKEYLVNPPLFRYNIPEKLQIELMNSCIKKLSSFSIFTVFSRQEFTVMLFAIDYYEKTLILDEIAYDTKLYNETINILCKLADPEFH